MALPISTVNIKIVADSAGVQSSVGGAISSLQGMTGLAAAAGGALGGAIGGMIGQAIGSSVQGVLSSISSVVSSSLGLAMDGEQALATFDALTGSAERAAQMVGELKALDLESPLSFADYQQGAKLLLGYGVEVSKVVSLQEQLGKVSMGNAEKLNHLSLAMGQVAASGRLMGQDANQLAQSGFPALNLISEKTGETFAEVKARMEAGGITFAEVQVALDGLTSGTGRFANINEKLLGTLGGQWTKFQGDLAIVGREFGEGLMPLAKEFVVVFSDMVAAAKQLHLGEWIKSALAPLTQVVSMFKGLRATVEWLGFKSEKVASSVTAADVRETIADIAPDLKFPDLEKQLTAAFKDSTESMVKAGEQFAAQFATPAEKFETEVRRAQELLSGGFISPDIFDRAIAKAAEGLEKATEDTATKLEAVKIGGFTRNTTAAFSATQEALRNGNDSIKADMERAANQRDKTNGLLRDIFDALRGNQIELPVFEV